MMSVYLLGGAALAAGQGAETSDILILAVMGVIALVVGGLGLWLTVPRRSRALELHVDQVSVLAGQMITGSVTTTRPDEPVSVGALCRGMRLADAAGGRATLGVAETTSEIQAVVTGDGAQRQFGVTIPPGAVASRRGAAATTQWFVVAREPGAGRRRRVAAIPVTVRR